MTTLIPFLAQVNFTAIDWVIVAVYLAVILGFGYYTNRFTGSIGNYLVAGRSVRKGLLIATFIGTELGLVTIAQFSELGFTSGFAGYHIGVLAFVMTAMVGLTGFVVYRLREAGIMTIPEYYEKRFGRKTRIVGGAILVLAGVLNMGMFLRAGAEFIGGLTGMADPFYIKFTMTALLAVVFAYVILGGVISVVITDYLQFTVLGIGFIVITAFCLSDVGWQGAVDGVVERQKLMQYAAQKEEMQKKKEEQAEQQADAAAQDSDRPDSNEQDRDAGAEGQRATAEEATSDSATERSAEIMPVADAGEAQERGPPTAPAEESDPQASTTDTSAASASEPGAASASAADDATSNSQTSNDAASNGETPEPPAGYDPAALTAEAEAEGFESNPEKGFNPFTSDDFGVAYVLYMIFLTFAGVALWQPVTIRALIAVSPKVAKQTYFWAAVGFLVRMIVPCFWGACAMAFVLSSDSPYSYGQFFVPSGQEQGPEFSTLAATGMYLGQLLPPVILGLIMAGMLAAFMSSQDSYLLAWSSSLVQDVVAPLKNDELSEKARILLTRITIFLIGCFLLFWGLWYPLEEGLWDYMAITGGIYFAGAFAVVAGGLYWKRASSTGAVLAMVTGTFCIVGIVPWDALTEWLTGRAEQVSGWREQWYEQGAEIATWAGANMHWLLVGTVLTSVAVMVVGSLLFPDRPSADAGEASYAG